jgi:regulatory protein
MRLLMLDDGRSLRVDVEAMARYGLAPGEPVASDLLAHLEAHDAYLRAREKAVRLLAARPRSTAELQHLLRRRRVSEEQARAVVRDLTAAGYLDDTAYARAWIASRFATRPCGAKRLRWELRKKGVSSAVMEQAIGEALGEEDFSAAEERHARSLIERRSRSYKNLSSQARLRRIAALLERRGFASDTIARVLRSVRRETAADLSDE